MATKKIWINTTETEKEIQKFFSEHKQNIYYFGSTVNQTFEAFVFASLANYYRKKGWKVSIVNPDSSGSTVKLKFNTRGKPSLYSYVLCSKGKQTVQIRHGLRVATRAHKAEFPHPANVVLDVAVVNNIDLSGYKTNDFVSNDELITFGEAKHMSAFAELIANFVGLAHEITPDVLMNIRSGESFTKNKHPAPFLYVSGYLYPTAKGLLESIRDRGYDIDVFDYETGKLFGVALPVTSPP